MPISSALGSSALLPAGLGFRNMLINGDMRIDQRNSGAAISGNGQYPVDRWSTASNTTGAWTFQQLSPTAGTTSSPIPPPGFRSYIKFTKTTGATPASTGQPNYFYQHVEGYNSAQLAWGTAGAKQAVLSFWVYSGSTGTFGGSIRSTSVNYWSFSFSYTISTANTWEYKIVQISPMTSGTWYTDNQTGLTIFFDLGSSADYRGTTSAWSNANYVGASSTSQYPTTKSGGYMCWTGVQLEQNYQPTPFEQRNYGIELSLCQRYYYRYSNPSGNGGAIGYIAGFSSTRSFGTIHIPVEMRGTITITPSGCQVDTLGLSNAGNVTAVALYPTVGNAPYTTTLFIDCVTTGTVAGTLYFFRVPAGASLQFSAEL